MIVHSSLLVPSQHPDRAVRSYSKTESSRMSWRCFSSKNDKKSIMVQSSQKKSFILYNGGNCLQLTSNELDWRMHVGHPVSWAVMRKPDTLLAFHASTVAGNAVIRASDTDVLVVLLGLIGRHLTSQRPKAYSCCIMDCGARNSLLHIDVSSIANALEAKQK